MNKDYYATLGVSKEASDEEIKQAYKKLAKKLHPDINKDPNATEKFKEINEAASVLLDKSKKASYDRFGTADTQSGDFSGFDFSTFGPDFDDIFESFFGGGMGSKKRRRSTRGNDIYVDIELTLEQAYSGKKTEITIPRYETCKTCEGSGAKSSASIKDCDECKGSGYVRLVRRTPFGTMQTTAPCNKCEGVGRYIKDPCKDCHGNGRIKKQREIEIEIPPGIDDNMKLRMNGEGEAAEKNGMPGDLYIIVRVKNHDFFERKGNDLYCEIPINFPQAALGDEIKIPTIDGSAMLKIPQGTESHTLLRMKGKGMPSLHDEEIGDQLVQVIIKTPKHLTKKQRELLEEFDKESEKPSFFERLKRKF